MSNNDSHQYHKLKQLKFLMKFISATICKHLVIVRKSPSIFMENISTVEGNITGDN